jgi:hypothetical protein
MVVSRATVRVPAASPVSTMSSARSLERLVGGHEGAGADFDVEDEGVEASASFLLMMLAVMR